MPKGCPRCGGFTYADDPYNPKTDIWCLNCGGWILPPNFKPLPLVNHIEDKLDADQWYIDDHGDIIDIIDLNIEDLVFKNPDQPFNVSYVAKAVHCSNSEARMTLDRLVRVGDMEIFRYGPQDRWLAYRRTL
jgi:hypothetical protein